MIGLIAGAGGLGEGQQDTAVWGWQSLLSQNNVRST